MSSIVFQPYFSLIHVRHSGNKYCVPTLYKATCLQVDIHINSFPGGSDGKESACSVGDPGSIPGSGRSPGEGNDNPLQYSCLENPMDGGAWWATAQVGPKGSDTPK